MLKSLAQKMVRSFGYEFSKKTESLGEIPDYPCIDILDLVMSQYVQTHPDVFFLQIGAHDGVSADPASQQIRKYANWRGILVEPQPDPFQQLVANYSGEKRFIFEQAAIGEQSGTMPFYTVTDDIAELTFWLPQSASFDREHIKNSLYYWKYIRKIDAIPEDFDQVIKTLQVPTLTPELLLQKHNVEKVDFLSLATPGFDFDILKMFPFAQFKPSIICFEYVTLSYANRRDCLRFLAEHGYSVSRFAAKALASLEAPTITWTIGDY
jgi:FkbM family methyltransferase